MLKIIIILFFCLISCKQYDKNTDIFFNLLSREEYSKEIEPNRIFNPSSAMFISVLPDYLGNLESNDEISDFEIIKNGLGYSKRYKNNKIKSGYWVDIFAYHNGLIQIPNDINNNIVRQAYNSEKQYILLNYSNSKILENNILVFTTQDSKNIKMYETIYEYWDIQNPTEKDEYISKLKYDTSSRYGFGHIDFYKNAYEVIKNNAEPFITKNQVLESIQTLCKIKESNKKGKPLKVKI